MVNLIITGKNLKPFGFMIIFITFCVALFYGLSLVSGIDVTTCGNLSTANTVYVQTANIIPNNISLPCINITANNITFNGGGFWIANSTFNNTGIYSTGLVNLTILNVNVSINRSSSSKGFGIDLIATNYSTIENSIFNFNYNGVFLRSGSSNNLIQNITTNDNNNLGLNIQSSYNTFRNITSNRNLLHGISTTSNNIFYNIISNNNSQNGVTIPASSNNNTFYNIILNNNSQNGIILQGQNSDNKIYNITSNNNNVGIRVVSSENNQFQNISSNSNGKGISLGESVNNSFEGGMINASVGNARAIYISYSEPDMLFSELKDNRFVNLNVTNTNKSGFDLYIEYSVTDIPVNLFINSTYFINTLIENYTIINSTNILNYGVELIVEDTRYGQVKFLSPVNGTGTNLTADIRILNNSVTVRSNVNIGLNKSANVTLYNLRADLGDPVILRDGSACASTICKNFTHLNAGTVVFNVSHWTNYSIWDITNPNVTIVSPTSQTYTVSTFLVNITLNEGGSCQYSLNNGATNKTLTADSLNRTFNATETGVSNGDYVIKTYCNDTVGNTNYTTNTSFSVSVSSGSSGGGSSGGGGGGGGGGSYAGQTYNLTSEDLIKGSELYLLAKDKISFKFNSINYNITLDSYNLSGASITIRPSLLAIVLDTNKSKSIDLNYDNKEDINLTYTGINLTKAKIFVQSLYSQDPSEEESDSETVKENNSKQDSKINLSRSLIYNIIFGILIIAGLVVVRLIISRQR